MTMPGAWVWLISGYALLLLVFAWGFDAMAKQTSARAAQWRPTIFNRAGVERWRNEGSRDLREAARDKALTILADYEAPPLDAEVAARVDELVDGFRPVAEDDA